LFIPDARFLGYALCFLFRKNTLKIILKQLLLGPPHSLHLIGLELKRKLDLTWFADFRDPWTTIGYHKALRLSNYATKKHKMLEHKVLNTADTIIVTSKTTKGN
jgi:hypothetical protein